MRRHPWKSLYQLLTCLCVLSADIIQGNHMKLKTLLLFKPKQQRHKQFLGGKKLEAVSFNSSFSCWRQKHRVSLFLLGVSQPSLEPKPGRNQVLLNPYPVMALPLWFTWMQLALFFIPSFYRIIPRRDWRKQMKYWKASNFWNCTPGSTSFARVWKRQEWRNSPVSKPLLFIHHSPVSCCRSEDHQKHVVCLVWLRIIETF